MTVDGVRAWKVVYHAALEPGEQRDPDLASIITILERSPDGQRGSVEGGKEATIAGHGVSLRQARGGETSHAVQWKTDQARYVALVGGETLQSLREIVRCMP